MKIAEIEQFKSAIKKALQDWGNAKIDELIPNRATPRVFMKNGLNNMLTRYDERLSSWIENIFLFVADENGVVDSDTMFDTLAGLFREMARKEYRLGPFAVTAGGGEAIVSFPHNFLTDMLVGEMCDIKFTEDDILDIKGMIV